MGKVKGHTIKGFDALTTYKCRVSPHPDSACGLILYVLTFVHMNGLVVVSSFSSPR